MTTSSHLSNFEMHASSSCSFQSLRDQDISLFFSISLNIFFLISSNKHAKDLLQQTCQGLHLYANYPSYYPPKILSPAPLIVMFTKMHTRVDESQGKSGSNEGTGRQGHGLNNRVVIFDN